MLKLRNWVVTPILFIALMAFYQNCSPFLSLVSTNNSFSNPPAISELQSKSIEILTTNCKSCHGDQDLGGIGDVTNVGNLTSTGLIVAGDVNGSQLMQAVLNNSMPPSGPLLEADKQVLRSWILALGGLDSNGQPINFQFAMTLNTDPLPFNNRMGKVNYVVGNTNSASLGSLYDSRYLLGDYDFANTVVPNYSWGASDANNWIKAVEPVCSSNDVIGKYTWPQDQDQFARDVYGRSLDSAEVQIINPINQMNVSNQEKMEIYCLTLMTTLEFVSK